MDTNRVEKQGYNKKDIKKIEYMAYLFMIFVGGSFPAIGVVIGDIAHALNVEVSTTVASYSIFTFSCTIMVFATTGLVLEFLSLKLTSLLAAYYCFSVLAQSFYPPIYSFLILLCLYTDSAMECVFL